jgi:hypothetical protein
MCSSVHSSLTRAYKECRGIITLDQNTKLAIFSDLHRGVLDVSEIRTGIDFS